MVVLVHVDASRLPGSHVIVPLGADEIVELATEPIVTPPDRVDDPDTASVASEDVPAAESQRDGSGL